MPTHQIAWIIRSCRQKRGFSQDYMADLLHITQSSYNNLESGKSSITIERLMHISEILDLDIREMITTGFQLKEESSTPTTLLLPATKEAYDKLIIEMQGEIQFLRNLIKSKQ